MKILYLQKRYHTNQHPIIKTLIEKNHNVRYISEKEGKNENYSVIKPYIMGYSKIYKIIQSMLMKKNDYKFTAKYGFPSIYALIKKIVIFNPNLIILKKFRLYTFPAFLIAKFLRIPVILYYQKPQYGGEDKTMIKILEKIGMYPSVKITPVKGGIKQHNNLKENKNVYYLPFIQNKKLEAGNRDYFKYDKINILMVGKFNSSRKNHILLLEAINILKNKYDFSVTLIGQCYDENNPNFTDIKSYISKNNLKKIVKIKENVLPNEMTYEYITNDLFVLPSSNEPASVSQLEAMAHGIPVVLSDSNGTRCYVHEGENGFVFKSDDAESLAHNIERIISNRKTLIKMGEASLTLIEKYHSPDSYYNSFVKIIHDHFRI